MQTDRSLSASTPTQRTLRWVFCCSGVNEVPYRNQSDEAPITGWQILIALLLAMVGLIFVGGLAIWILFG